jgi:hypothetical protein
MRRHATSVVPAAVNNFSSASLPKARTSLSRLCKDLILRMATMLPVSDRKEIMTQWMAQESSIYTDIAIVENQLLRMRLEVETAKASHVSALQEVERLR